MVKKNIYRSTDCGSLRLKDAGKTETLSGFVDTIRKLGGLNFVVLRDFYGKTQIGWQLSGNRYPPDYRWKNRSDEAPEQSGRPDHGAGKGREKTV